MAVVIDAGAYLDYCCRDEGPTAVEQAIESEVCYLTPIAVVEIHGTLWDRMGSERADAVLGLIMSGQDVKVVTDFDKEFVSLISEAKRRGAVVSAAYAAALARRMNVPVLSNSPDIQDLAREGFCSVRSF